MHYSDKDVPCRKEAETDSYTLVVALLHRGYGKEALKLAEASGARGVTFLQGRGNILERQDPRDPELSRVRKEWIWILAHSAVAEELLKTFHRVLGLDSQARGVFYALPVQAQVGLPRRTLQETILTQIQREKREDEHATDA